MKWPFFIRLWKGFIASYPIFSYIWFIDHNLYLKTSLICVESTDLKLWLSNFGHINYKLTTYFSPFAPKTSKSLRAFSILWIPPLYCLNLTGLSLLFSKCCEVISTYFLPKLKSSWNVLTTTGLISTEWELTFGTPTIPAKRGIVEFWVFNSLDMLAPSLKFPLLIPQVF